MHFFVSYSRTFLKPLIPSQRALLYNIICSSTLTKRSGHEYNGKSKAKWTEYSSLQTCLTATRARLPHGITQRYLWYVHFSPTTLYRLWP